MKIAIPVKTNQENPAVSPLFGKAKWFAFIEDGKIEIRRNTKEGGDQVIEWFAEEAVDTIVMQEMGMTPYRKIQSYGGIEIYFSGSERVLLLDVIEKLQNQMLEKVDDVRMMEIIHKHEKDHTHHDHAPHEHGHTH